jgi:hypothetical protein
LTWSETREGQFGYLSSNDQWDLHRFYRLTSHMTDTELIAHRRSVTKADPSLPHRAGRAYAKLSRGEWQPAVYAGTANGKAIMVRSVVNPQPNAELFARALIELAKQQQGLAPSWSRSHLDSLSTQRYGDGHRGDAIADSKPGQ